MELNSDATGENSSVMGWARAMMRLGVLMMRMRWLVVVLVLWSLISVVGEGEAFVGKAIPADRLIPNLQEGLQLLAEAHPGELAALAESQGLSLREGRVTVVVETEAGFSAVDVAGLGGRVAYQAQGLAEVSFPPGKLAALAGLRGVAYVRRPYHAEPLTLSQGVALTGAPAWHAAGVTGAGVRVAVIDLEFGGLTRAVNLGRLRHVVRTADYTGTGMETGGVHGTACAEIVQDMAPDAQLILLKVGTEVQLAQAVEDALSWGATVINHSVGWFNTNFYDGTGVIGDIVRRATGAGALWVNAAGNSARAHWAGPWTDTSASGFHEFAPGVELNNFQLNPGDAVHIWLTWDGWPLTDQDYDLYLVDTVRGAPVASSTGHQSGQQPPEEHIAFSSPSGGTYGVVIHRHNAPQAPGLQLFLSSNVSLEHSLASRSIAAPGNAQESFTVAAIDWQRWETGPQEEFSAQGPTSVSRLVSVSRVKPDITGPDRVATTSYSQPFAGTSAAAPHVAGAAALLLAANPHWSVNALRSYLADHAVDMGPPGKDNVYGSGRLALGEPLEPAPPGPTDSHAFPGGWNMVSVRWTPADPSPGTVFAGAGTPLQIWEFDPGVGQYVVPREIQPARGYWLRVPAGGATIRVDGEAVSHDVARELGAAGWHQISAPWEIARSDLRFRRGGQELAWDQAVAAGWVGRALWGYRPGQAYYDATVLVPWQGYWLQTGVPGVEFLLDYGARRR